MRHVAYRNEESSGARGRPRDAELERRITAAVLEVLAEHRYEDLSFEAVARRCQTSKASLYRRWGSKRDMVIAAVKAGPAQHSTSPLPQGATLREDLLSLVRRLERTMAAADIGTALMLLQAGLKDPELCDAIESSAGPTGARLPQAVIDAAVARGELPTGASPFAFDEVVGSVLLLRHANGLAVDDAYLSALLDTVIIPALVASSTSATTLPAGLFSGHPETRATNRPQEDS
ncbi:TetR/AcrR family transcriptional regulator [Micromonospora sp. RL09-050-HVF-A]|nr:TetR/AcrR family transcriptional regulator [Micromonospora sp. RL09-050-HVF-A]